MANKRKRYSKELKESIIKRIQEPNNESVTVLSKETGVPRTTIYDWIKKRNANIPLNNKSTSKWSSEEKFQVVLETSTFNEAELAEYCRKKGVYVSEVKAWRNQCLNANKNIPDNPEILKENLKKEKNKNKDLEKELRTK
ncbi:transposase, partial [Senegalia sp. (in: firmicutes)]|uniref:transposase n=1 Tax=Senegalia sp. (in: firmicutes) TaxID=1924098 RepID=UPI003F994A15